MRTLFDLRRISLFVLLAAGFLIASQPAVSQEAQPAWNFTRYFRYNIENIVVQMTAPQTWNVKVIFSVTNPNPDRTVPNTTWDIKNDLPFQSPGGSVTIDIGWDPAEYTNTGGLPPGTPSLVPRLTALDPVVTTSLGTAAAPPIQIRNLVSKTGGANPCVSFADCPGATSLVNRFWVQRSIRPFDFVAAVRAGAIGMEGHPVCDGIAGCPAPVVNPTTGALVYSNIPIRSEVASFSFLATTTPTSAVIADPRRRIVDFQTKCFGCHDGDTLSGNGTLIPRLSLHGNNRNENLRICVICHNPNQTDVAYRLLTADSRTAGPETPINFTRMVHAIHAGGFRETPWVIIGRNTSINDFSDVRYPGELRNCLNCHIDINRRGTFELPLPSGVLGSTADTGSDYAVPAGSVRTIDVDPFNDLKITPIAAACSGCHDKTETRTHMVRTGGASFATLQATIGTRVVERCQACHGPGTQKDVRRVHEVR